MNFVFSNAPVDDELFDEAADEVLSDELLQPARAVIDSVSAAANTAAVSFLFIIIFLSSLMIL